MNRKSGGSTQTQCVLQTFKPSCDSPTVTFVGKQLEQKLNKRSWEKIESTNNNSATKALSFCTLGNQRF